MDSMPHLTHSIVHSCRRAFDALGFGHHARVQCVFHRSIDFQFADLFAVREIVAVGRVAVAADPGEDFSVGKQIVAAAARKKKKYASI